LSYKRWVPCGNLVSLAEHRVHYQTLFSFGNSGLVLTPEFNWLSHEPINEGWVIQRTKFAAGAHNLDCLFNV